MRLILKYISTLEELKSIIVQNKDDEQFREELVDSMVDGELQDWLLAHNEDCSDEVESALTNIDFAESSDTELLQNLYEILGVDCEINKPDLSDSFEFVGIRVDGKYVTTQGITIDDNLRHAICAVIRVRKPMNEKLKLVLELHLEKQQVSTKETKRENSKVPTDRSDHNSSIPDGKGQFPSQAMGSIVAGMVALKYSQLLQNNPNGEPNKLTDENRRKLEEYIQTIRGAFGTLLMPPMISMAFAKGSVRNAFEEFMRGHLLNRFSKEVSLNVASNTLLEVTFPELHLGKGEVCISYDGCSLVKIPINKQ